MAPPPPPPPPPPILDGPVSVPPPPPAPPIEPSIPASQPQTVQTSLQPGSAPAGDEKVWERPWSVSELRKGSANWTLAGDAGVGCC